MEDKIKVAIADDHMLFRKGVMISLRMYDNIEFVFEAENGEDLIMKLPEYNPDVVLCDLKMPGKDGIDATKHIISNYPNIKVIILSMYDDERFISHLMDSGAAGYLLKNTEGEEIRKAIMDVVHKGYYLTPLVNKILLKKNYSKQKHLSVNNAETEISPREKEVLTLLCMEFTATEIAEKIKISPRTVEAIKDRLMERFEVKNSIGLVFYALKHKIVD